MRWGIRYRLLLPLGGLMFAVIGISAWSAFLAAHHAEERIVAQVGSVAQTLSNATFPLTPNVLEQMKGLSGAEYLLISPEGRVSTFATASIPLPEDAFFESDEASPEKLGPLVPVLEQSYHCLRVQLRRPHPNAGGTIYLFYPETLRNEAVWNAVRPTLWGFFFGMAAVLFTLGMGQQFVKQIRTLERRTRLIAEGDFSPMTLPRTQDELHDLARSINEMAARLAQLQATVLQSERFRVLSQLSSGLAHQLRNSVAGARLALQVHQTDCTGDAESLEVVLRQLSLLEVNLRRFLDLGKSEIPMEKDCSLSEIIQEILALYRPQCRHAGTKLIAPEEMVEQIVRGDPGQLRDLFINLVANAIEAAGPNGTVEVRPHPVTMNESIQIDVIDSGEGPTPEIASRLGEPFVTGKPEGIGLGFRIAQQVVENHRGQLIWFRENGHTFFRVTLPIGKSIDSLGH